MEYFHRMWGRAIGITFALPALFFMAKKWVPKHVKPRLGIYTGIILFQVTLLNFIINFVLVERVQIIVCSYIACLFVISIYERFK